MSALGFAELGDELRARLRAPLPGAAAQQTMASRPTPPDWSPDARPANARHAGALVLIYETEVGPTVALTERRHDLPHHPGQISLPGGALAPGESALQAALREAEEEIGVPADAIDLVGALSTVWIPVSNFVLAPFVGLAHETPRFIPHPAEVAAIVPVPLAWLADGSRVRWGHRKRGGVPIEFPYFDLGRHQLWGATAMVLAELAHVLGRASGGPGTLPERP